MAIVGLALGHAGAPVLVKVIGPGRRAHAEGLVARWGALAIVFSRPVPLLAETVVLAAGAARLPWRTAVPAAFVGSLPEALAYGLVGDAAASAANGALVWAGFLLAGTLFRVFELLHRRRSRATSAARIASTTMGGR
jgi:3-dehydroquinate synthase